MNISERVELSQYLKWGDIKKLAKEIGVSEKTVQRYIKGQTNKCISRASIEDLLRLRKKESQSVIAQMAAKA
jgi:AraC-like DNA-binding protein